MYLETFLRDVMIKIIQGRTFLQSLPSTLTVVEQYAGPAFPLILLCQRQLLVLINLGVSDMGIVYRLSFFSLLFSV